MPTPQEFTQSALTQAPNSQLSAALPAADLHTQVFSAASDAWTEGLLLLSPAGDVLLINPAASNMLDQLAVGDSLPASGLCSQAQFETLQSGMVPPGLFQRGNRPITCRCQQLDVGLMVTLTPPGPQTDALQQTARFLDSIIENIPDMIFVKEARDLRFQRFNKAGERLLGIPHEELLGRNDHDLFPKEQADFFMTRDRETLAGKTVVDIPEEPLETRHGLRWLHTKKIPILDDNNEPIYLLGISADITAQKNAEDALLRINEELERRVAETVATLRQTQEQLLQSQKMEALGRLAGGVAHDFNNLLTVISGYGELLNHHAESTEDIRRHVAQMLEAASRAADLTRQMLAFSRQQFLQPRVIEFNARVKGMVKLLERLIGEHIHLKLNLSPDDLTITADPGQIDQVIMNLAVNARDAMPEGGSLIIETKLVSELLVNTDSDLTPGPYALFAIQDTGHGMAPEVLGRIFEPFYTTKQKGQGTGLGLATSYGIVKQSMGDIQVESEPGVGTVFKVYLPLTSEHPDQDQEDQPYQAQLLPTETLLLVEDEPAVRKLLAKVVEKAGYRVLTASDGQSALNLIQDNAVGVDLLLTDLVMPGMSGRELAETLIKRIPGLKVVYMSGYSDDVLFQEGKIESREAFIHKPFRPDALLELLQQMLCSED